MRVGGVGVAVCADAGEWEGSCDGCGRIGDGGLGDGRVFAFAVVPVVRRAGGVGGDGGGVLGEERERGAAVAVSAASADSDLISAAAGN